MSYFVLVGGVILLAAGLWMLIARGRSRSGGTRPTSSGRIAAKNNLKSTANYQSVTIEPQGMDACEAAQNAEGQVFLASAAPTLPLEGCTADKCDCRYVYHQDRRLDERRQHHHLEEGYLESKEMRDRRTLTDRRPQPPRRKRRT